MDQRNFTYMFYGFLVAWAVVLFYVISLAQRSARLKKELEGVRQLISSSGIPAQEHLEDRIR